MLRFPTRLWLFEFPFFSSKFFAFSLAMGPIVGVMVPIGAMTKKASEFLPFFCAIGPIVGAMVAVGASIPEHGRDEKKG